MKKKIMNTQSAPEFLVIEGAAQNNLKHISLTIPLYTLTVVTGVSGSGKSSLAFDTVYAEGQRRYVETFSPYTRQFLSRMEKPKVDRISGIPPAVAIDQTNPVRTSRSTVGTMTELADHLKLLFARRSVLYCRQCGKRVRRDTPDSVFEELQADLGPDSGRRLVIAFPVPIPESFSEDEAAVHLRKLGWERTLGRHGGMLLVVQDRVVLRPDERQRIIDDLETAFRYGNGRVSVFVSGSTGGGTESDVHLKFSSDLHCARCDIHYRDPVPNLFSFNSPLGACETCRGFGRVIGIDYGLVIPDESKSLRDGAVRPWQSESYRECRDDLLAYAKKRDIPVDVPWQNLTASQKAWVLEGEGEWEDRKWYGVSRFFKWLETKSYKMHIRVLLAKYRSYGVCPACGGARLKPEALDWRIGDGAFSIHDVVRLPIVRCRKFFASQEFDALDGAGTIVIEEIRKRLEYLTDVGLGYLTLDRQSRTLSGGEVQRINLTTALGTSLVNTLFILDEPSIGLHPRDIGRLVGILTRLRDAGNTILVVEHDPDVIRAADRIIDMGPGAGEHGGEIVFNGTFHDMLVSDTSLTGRYLAGTKAVVDPDSRETATPRTGFRRRKTGTARDDGGAGQDSIRIYGAAEHNLAGLDVSIPLKKLVSITGVSGSGKSTLMDEVLYRSALRYLRKPTEQPGKHDGISGLDLLENIVFVDQSPIGKTTRSNPASYVGAFDPIRRIFAGMPLSRERGYTPGTFSFNAGNGRCPTCGGTGFEHIEMQFLSDVYLRCPDCDGTRYRKEIREVRIPVPGGKPDTGKSIADVLAMTVSEACSFFAGRKDVLTSLVPLISVGLEYLTLGQPVPTLSGGEAQRLKLAGYLRDTGKASKSGKHTLFLFDEPTTGLHFQDIAVLLRAFRSLLSAGHSVIVIEHNLDVIAASDHILDLGPEGGEGGGRLVAEGSPRQVAEGGQGHTAGALVPYFGRMDSLKARGDEVSDLSPAPYGIPAETSGSVRGDGGLIRINHAREHNLRNIDLEIPRDTFTVITGVSGSGKSTVAFDILFSEGQRRYLESLNAYARQFVQPAQKPDVDSITGVPPTVAIEQRTSRGGRKSTLATMTEVYHFLRLLYVKLGTRYCPDCRIPIEPLPREGILSRIMQDSEGETVDFLAPLVAARKGYYTDLAAWASGKGFESLRVDGVYIPVRKWPRLDRYREHSIELPTGSCVITPEKEETVREVVDRTLEYGKGTVRIVSSDGTETVYSTQHSCRSCGRGFEAPDPRLFSFNSRHGWCPSCFGTGTVNADNGDEPEENADVFRDESLGDEEVCPECGGKRLNREALSILFRDRSISDFCAMTVGQAEGELRGLDLSGRDHAIAEDILKELTGRLEFLREVGLAYLSLDRSAPTLSGGEAQRIRLASQLGSNLQGVCYILDEPTIGLHPRDNRMLLSTLIKLKERGNSVVVVEHDEDTIRQAEYLVDLGPGGGRDGGSVLAAGTAASVLADPDSITARCLRHPLVHPLRGERRSNGKGLLVVRHAALHNLKGFDVSIPLENIVCVTGVSGSGKSTLVRDVIHDNLRNLKKSGEAARVTGCAGLEGWERFGRILEVDQTPIGKTPRSCPATYVGFWDEIRKLFAGTPEARIKGYTPARFSFNVAGGRCEYCGGQGVVRVEMNFLPDVTVPCEECSGKRFNTETCAVLFKGKSIADVLLMSVDEAVDYFTAHPKIRHPLSLLRDVGLGYLTLGRQSPTLSGGEAQRIKLVSELARVNPDTGFSEPCLFVLDEPTVGLHMADVEKLIRVLHKLVDSGATVLLIEHNLDVMAEADYLIDLGPEGGDGGGSIVAEGTPETVAVSGTHTGKILQEFLHERKPRP